MLQYQEKTIITRIEQFTDENFRLTLQTNDIARVAKPGQFVMIRAGEAKDPLLRRPFSIHQTSSNGEIQIYFRVVGRGTQILAHCRVGESLAVFGPLGRGYRLKEEQPACLIGGGLGIAPILFLAKQFCTIKKDVSSDIIVLGGRSKKELEPLVDDFSQFGMRLVLATDDGSLGEQGYIHEVLQRTELPEQCTMYVCGPEPMMESVAGVCATRGYGCQVSVESSMACGMGACLGCSMPVKSGTYAHVCLDGPVFDAEEMVWNS